MTIFAAMQDLKPQRAIESDSSWHFVGAQCDRADPVDHGQPFPVFLAQKAGCRPRSSPSSRPTKLSSAMAEDEATVYDFVTELTIQEVSDATYSRAKKIFNDQRDR